MSSSTEDPRRTRWLPGAIVALLVAVIVAFVVVGVLAAAGSPKGGGGVPAAAGPSSTAGGSASTGTRTSPTPQPSATLMPKTKATKPVAAKPEPTPQPTKTAAISKPVTIVRAFAATVTRAESVQGKAEGPGDIGGPSVRFTIRLRNTTGKAVDLSNTVVNAYFGAHATPAVQLRQPGGRDFPSSVADGASATGVYLFNVPKADRDHVEVTVDTSVENPVVAFEGGAPR